MSHFCSCADTACPLHPKNHDKGCTPCISKNLKEGEIPSCFFNAIGGGDRPAGYSYRHFAGFVAERLGPEAPKALEEEKTP